SEKHGVKTMGKVIYYLAMAGTGTFAGWVALRLLTLLLVSLAFSAGSWGALTLASVISWLAALLGFLCMVAFLTETVLVLFFLRSVAVLIQQEGLAKMILIQAIIWGCIAAMFLLGSPVLMIGGALHPGYYDTYGSGYGYGGGSISFGGGTLI